MLYDPISTVKYLQRFPQTLDAFMNALEIAVLDGHDNAKHNFSNDGTGVCSICFWVHPDVPSGCSCERSLQEHLVDLLHYLNSLTTQFSGAIDLNQVIISIHKNELTHSFHVADNPTHQDDSMN